ncbi:uncharacterized protein VTP21DRAFT_8101 [Calcarisporiella thermophila]|uniref:uncharacterized protein n=1 Tax=Calcarisporiella thermophila TaxID=911321 RepID=UPI003741EE78
MIRRTSLRSRTRPVEPEEVAYAKPFLVLALDIGYKHRNCPMLLLEGFLVSTAAKQASMNGRIPPSMQQYYYNGLNSSFECKGGVDLHINEYSAYRTAYSVDQELRLHSRLSRPSSYEFRESPMNRLELITVEP